MTESTGAAAPAIAIELHLRYSRGFGALAPYFAGLERGAAMATVCAACHRTWFAPRLVCSCGSESLAWIELSGRGTVVALTQGRAIFPGTDIRGEFDLFDFALIRLAGTDNLCFGRLGVTASHLGPGSAVRLARAMGEWAHPAQCAEYVPDTGGTQHA